MRKKIIIFAIGLVLVLACFFEYSNYQNGDKGEGQASVFGDTNSSYTNFEFESSIRVLTLNINTECGEFIKNEYGGYGQNMKNIPNKGSVVIKVEDDESNVVKSFTIKGGESLSKTVLIGKGSYHLEVDSADNFKGKIKREYYVWKLI